MGKIKKNSSDFFHVKTAAGKRFKNSSIKNSELVCGKTELG